MPVFYCLAKTSVIGEMLIQGNSVTYSATASAFNSSNISFKYAAKVATINSNSAAIIAARNTVNDILKKYEYVLYEENITSMINNSLKTTIHPITPIGIDTIARKNNDQRYVLFKNTTIGPYDILIIKFNQSLQCPEGIVLTNNGIIQLSAKSTKNTQSISCACEGIGLSISGECYNTGSIIVDSEHSYVVDSGGICKNNGIIEVKSGGCCTISSGGVCTNYATLTIDSGGCVTIEDDGLCSNGDTTTCINAIVYNYGTLNNYGILNNYYTISNGSIDAISNGSIDAIFNIYSTGILTNLATFCDGKHDEYGTIYNYGTIVNSGSIIHTGNYINNYGKITNDNTGIFTVGWDDTDATVMQPCYYIYPQESSIFTNDGILTIQLNGEILENGAFTNNGIMYSYGLTAGYAPDSSSINNGTIYITSGYSWKKIINNSTGIMYSYSGKLDQSGSISAYDTSNSYNYGRIICADRNSPGCGRGESNVPDAQDEITGKWGTTTFECFPT